MKKLVVLAAGGTGGHLFPASALGGELLLRGWAVVLITDRRGSESGASAALRDATTYVVSSGTPAGTNLFAAAWVVLQIFAGTCHAWWLLLRLRPAVVVGFGGYPALPTMWAALQRRIPILIHEQNAVLGRVNRLLAKHASGVALSYVETARLPTGSAEIVVTGNPIRAEILGERESAYRPSGDKSHFSVLIIGGSQGARVFSKVVPEALRLLPDELRRRLEVEQQCRPEDRDRIDAEYRRHGIVASCETFYVDVARRIADAHVVIARAGASSVAELACIGRPAILVPLPYAADDHQSANAQAFASDGAAIVVQEDSEFSAKALAGLLKRLMMDPDALATMAEKARSWGRADADIALATFVERIAGLQGGVEEATS